MYIYASLLWRYLDDCLFFVNSGVLSFYFALMFFLYTVLFSFQLQSSELSKNAEKLKQKYSKDQQKAEKKKDKEKEKAKLERSKKKQKEMEKGKRESRKKMRYTGQIIEKNIELKSLWIKKMQVFCYSFWIFLIYKRCNSEKVGLRRMIVVFIIYCASKAKNEQIVIHGCVCKIKQPTHGYFSSAKNTTNVFLLLDRKWLE